VGKGGAGGKFLEATDKDKEWKDRTIQGPVAGSAEMARKRREVQYTYNSWVTPPLKDGGEKGSKKRLSAAKQKLLFLLTERADTEQNSGSLK